MQEHINAIKKSSLLQLMFAFVAILTLWWISMFMRELKEGVENNIFTLIYPLLSLVGGVIGFFAAKKWGGFKSYLGGSVSMFSFGLLAQFFGQASYAYYIYIKGIEVPYPSMGDVGYFGSVLLYILGVILLAKVSGIKLSFKSLVGKLQLVLIPFILLLVPLLFLRLYMEILFLGT